MKKPRIWILVGPSGVGKTTVVRGLLKFAFEHELLYEQAISFTTRPPREGELDGVDYHFINLRDIERMLVEGELAEHIAVPNGDVHVHYGFTKDEFDSRLESGIDVIAIVEPHGIEQIKKLYPGQVSTIFLKPPTPEVPHERMRARGDSEEMIAKRAFLDSRINAYETEADFTIVAANQADTLVSLIYVLTTGFNPQDVVGVQEAA